jgi:hypothetical protein
MLLTRQFLLEAPYNTATRIDLTEAARSGQDLQVGSICLIQTEHADVAMTQILVAHVHWPWVPVVVSGIDHAEFREDPLARIVPESSRIAVLRSDSHRQIDAVSRAVRSRPAPEPLVLAEYVVSRLGHTRLLGPLAEKFDLHLPVAREKNPSTYSRLFRQYGPFTALGWRSISRLIRAQCIDFDERTGRHVQDVGTSRRTLDKYCIRFVGMTVRQANRIAGWEWLTETSLRRHSYMADSSFQVRGETGS